MPSNSLASINPVLAGEWHPTKNGDLTPEQVTAGAKLKVWWLGSCGHEWDAPIGPRNNGFGCPICSNKRILAGFNDLATINPVLAAEWHPTKNGSVTPEQIFPSTNKKYWWLGTSCGHEWDAVVNSRNQGLGCSVCSNRRLLTGFNDLATTNPELAAEWHPTKNGDLTPEQVTAGISEKIWWKCEADHEWQAIVVSRNRGNGCPYCSGRLLVGFNDLETVNPEVASQWHPTKNGTVTPQQVTTGSTQKIWWLGDCNHEWQTSVAERHKGSKCPYCLNQKILTGFNDLAFLNPALASEWHPTKNGTLTAEQISLKSNKNVWWQCKQGHEWKITPNHRTLTGCPVCANKKVLSGFNDLGTTHPLIAAEWHPTKNGDITPEQVIAGSGKKYWWRGACTHEWEAGINSRSNGGSGGTGCPVCVNSKVLIGFNDLATTNPKIAAEWHPTKNGNLTPQQVIAGSNKKYWWLGALCGHEWATPVNERNSGSGCLICINKEILVGFNDLDTTNPDLAAEWHPTKNGNLTAEQVSAGSNRRVWWQCAKNHEWEAVLNSRVSGNGCPFCSNQRVLSGYNDLVTTNPELAAEWHPTKNGNLTAEQVTAGSNKKYWWKGSFCGHEWEALASSRNKGNGCPVCSNMKILIGFNDLATTNPELVAEWHPTKNENLTAEHITAGSHKKVWWICSKDHVWETLPYKRTERGDGCPVCSNRIVLAGFNDLVSRNPKLAAEWHPTKNGTLTPDQITAGTHLKVWWECSKKHEWRAGVVDRYSRGCPVCSNRKVVIGYNDLASKNPRLGAEWHPTKNGDLTAEQITEGYRIKVWWQCSKGHEWEVSPGNRTAKGGTSCPQCWATTFVSKAEQELHDYIDSLDEDMEIIQSDRKALKGKELDIYIPEKKVGIEFNGIYWHKEKFVGKQSHHNKYLAAQKAGIQLIQIWEDDWDKKPEVVKRMLMQALQEKGQETMQTSALPVQTITEMQAEQFLAENHVEGFIAGVQYLGVFAEGDIEALEAVLVLGIAPNAETKILNIVRYAASRDLVKNLYKMVSHVINAYSPASIVAGADNCGIDGELYKAVGFREEKVLPSDYMYVMKNQRKPRSGYPLERFCNDSKLLWEEGLTEMELADLNGLERIWDAGKTCYRLVL